MIIIRRRGEVVRFVLFLMVIGVMAYYVASRWESWHLTRVDHLPAAQPAEDLLPGLPPPESQTGMAGQEAEVAREDFFAAFRMTRAQSRSALRETLREIMANPDAGEEARSAAEAEYVQLGRHDALEEQAEALVKARGFADAVVHITGESAQVVVRAKSLTPQQASQVVDTVSRVTGVKAGDVQVLARER